MQLRLRAWRLPLDDDEMLRRQDATTGRRSSRARARPMAHARGGESLCGRAQLKREQSECAATLDVEKGHLLGPPTIGGGAEAQLAELMAAAGDGDDDDADDDDERLRRATSSARRATRSEDASTTRAASCPRAALARCGADSTLARAAVPERFGAVSRPRPSKAARARARAAWPRDYRCRPQRGYGEHRGSTGAASGGGARPGTGAPRRPLGAAVVLRSGQNDNGPGRAAIGRREHRGRSVLPAAIATSARRRAAGPRFNLAGELQFMERIAPAEAGVLRPHGRRARRLRQLSQTRASPRAGGGRVRGTSRPARNPRRRCTGAPRNPCAREPIADLGTTRRTRRPSSRTTADRDGSTGARTLISAARRRARAFRNYRARVACPPPSLLTSPSRAQS